VQRSSLCFDFSGRWERVLIKYTPRERCDWPYKVMPADDAAITGRKTNCKLRWLLPLIVLDDGASHMAFYFVFG